MNEQEINWIDVNLPWRHIDSGEGFPTSPDMQEKERVEFGLSVEELQEKTQPDLEACRKLSNELDELQDAAVKRARETGINYSDYIISPEYQQIEKDFWALHEKDSCVIVRDLYIELSDIINAWSEQQPEWLDYQEKLKKYYNEDDQKSFSRSGLAQPGTLVEMEDGSIEMIGSINTSGGVCNDCMAFSDSMIVKRYAVVYPFTKKKANDENSE